MGKDRSPANSPSDPSLLGVGTPASPSSHCGYKSLFPSADIYCGPAWCQALFQVQEIEREVKI